MIWHLIVNCHKEQPDGLYCEIMEGAEITSKVQCVDPHDMPSDLTFADCCPACVRSFLAEKQSKDIQ